MAAKKQPGPVGLRLPVELKEWVRRQAAANRSSMNSEIVRAVRERRNRVERRQAAAA